MIGKLLRCISNNFTSKDYYKILGVTPTASKTEIRSAYLKLAKQYHPDSSTGDEEKFKQLGEAWSVLGKENSRSEYDAMKNPGTKYGDFTQWNNTGNSNYGNTRNTAYNNPFYQWNQQTKGKSNAGFNHNEQNFDEFFREQAAKSKNTKRKTEYYEYYDPRTGRRAYYSYKKERNYDDYDDNSQKYKENQKKAADREYEEFMNEFSRGWNKDDWEGRERKAAALDFFIGASYFFAVIFTVSFFYRMFIRRDRYDDYRRNAYNMRDMNDRNSVWDEVAREMYRNRR
ncbi:hypothetical protein SteCoe_1703 [Stentor coeruleus]|uniref:J domain-containing protein n=1 Tax=Stentor coeruleus TaxID=5963 RepID=A0A1R2D163_9CILI|nr:hypothetical protein SteCoe_1703 [Stentor coeruleus]